MRWFTNTHFNTSLSTGKIPFFKNSNAIHYILLDFKLYFVTTSCLKLVEIN